MATFLNKTKDDIESHKSIYTAKLIWEGFKDCIYSNGSFYQWGGQVYKKIDDIDWMILMCDRFPALNEFRPSLQKEIMEVYKRFSKIPVDEFNKEDGLCFLNTYLDLKNLYLHAHDKIRINTILIPYNYDVTAQCELWLSTLKVIFENDFNRINSLQEFFGYCLSKDTRYEKSMFLYGEGGTGKSVILDSLRDMIDIENVSFVSLRHFFDSVRLSSLQNKLINICTEVPPKAEDYEEMYKKIVSGEYIEVSPKYIPQYAFKPFVKLIFAINDWPHIADKSSAFFRRMLVLGVNNAFTDENSDKDLKEKLKTETPGILNWAIEGLKRIRKQKGFYITESMKEEIEEIKTQNNPIITFLKEHIREEQGKEILKTDLYKTYNTWCGLNGYKTLGSAKFGAELFRVYRRVTKKDARHASGDRARIWPNITWASNPQIEDMVEWDGQDG